MTRKVFWEDPYKTTLKTKICSVNDDRITVADTIFYAFSGGQESDSGTIGGYKVLKAEKVGKEIFYTVTKGHNLKVGYEVTISIDWQRRYRLMRLHFAAEIVLELIYKKFPKITKVGAHIAEEKARIDFIFDNSLLAYLYDIQEMAQSIIDSNLEILSEFSSLKDEKRYWKIANFSEVPCGGTHVKNTKEIGRIRLKRKNPGKGKERVEIYLAIQ